jgi:hypothetical protein
MVVVWLTDSLEVIHHRRLHHHRRGARDVRGGGGVDLSEATCSGYWEATHRLRPRCIGSL